MADTKSEAPTIPPQLLVVTSAPSHAHADTRMWEGWGVGSSTRAEQVWKAAWLNYMGLCLGLLASIYLS